MKTDPDASGMASAGDGPEKKTGMTLRRAGKVGLDLILPISDVQVIYRTGVLPTVRRFKLLRDMLRKTPTDPVALNWEEAVACAGRPIEQLRATFKRTRAAWWILMAVPGALSIILLLMVLLTMFGLPSGILLRAVITIVILAALGCVGFAKTLVVTYRLWQLDMRRVSEAERGTFNDFLAENRWCRQVLTMGIAK